jgi:hypothetical protein
MFQGAMHVKFQANLDEVHNKGANDVTWLYM